MTKTAVFESQQVDMLLTPRSSLGARREAGRTRPFSSQQAPNSLAGSSCVSERPLCLNLVGSAFKFSFLVLPADLFGITLPRPEP